jgi:hypothetical protein
MNKENEGKVKIVRKTIIETIVFFDLFDYPLTAWETWKLGQWQEPVSLVEVMACLEDEETKQKIGSKFGFYFLPGREDIIVTRQTRYNITDQKIKRALKIARTFSHIPWIKMIAVSNVIGSHNMKIESDIDLLIVAADGRLWLTRFFCVAIIKLLGLRPGPGMTRDTICLNFYVSESALDVKDLRLPDDIYFIYWLAGLIPIYDSGGIYEKLIAANHWFVEVLPNWRPADPAKSRLVKSTSNSTWRKIIDLVFGGLEGQSKKMQMRIMPDELKGKMNSGTDVVINDQILKLHPKDRRREYLDLWKKKVAESGI